MGDTGRLPCPGAPQGPAWFQKDGWPHSQEFPSLQWWDGTVLDPLKGLTCPSWCSLHRLHSHYCHFPHLQCQSCHPSRTFPWHTKVLSLSTQRQLTGLPSFLSTVPSSIFSLILSPLQRAAFQHPSSAPVLPHLATVLIILVEAPMIHLPSTCILLEPSAPSNPAEPSLLPQAPFLRVQDHVLCWISSHVGLSSLVSSAGSTYVSQAGQPALENSRMRLQTSSLPCHWHSLWVKSRQEADATPQPPSPGYSNWRLILYWPKLPEKNSRAIKGGGWTLHRPHTSHSLSQEPSLTSHMQKRPPGRQRRFMSRMFYPQAFSVGFILAKRCVHTHGRFLRYTKYGLWTRTNQNDWPNGTQKK